MTSRSRFLRPWALVLLACLFVPGVAPCQNKEELAEMKKRIAELINRGEELAQRGREAEAKRMFAAAKDLQARWNRESKGGPAKGRRSEGGRSRERLLKEAHGGVFHHLEQAIHALQKIGRREQARKLEIFSKELYQDLNRRRGNGNGGEGEREGLQRELKVMRYAKAAFAESGKKDALEAIERAMHARELMLEGRRDREARRIIERAPKRGELAELMAWAAKILAEYNAREQAGACKKLSAELARRRDRERGRERRREGERERERGREGERGRERERQGGRRRERREEPNKERQVALQQLEILRFAAGVLDKARRGDAAESMEMAAHSLKLRLDGRRDREARQVIERAPKRGQIAELLGLTAEILADQGQKDRAERVAKTAKQFAPRRRERREGGGERERERKKGEPKTERQVAMQQLEILGYSAGVLREARRGDAAEAMRLAAQSLKLRLAGRRGEEAQQVYKRAPKRGQVAELLSLTAKILAEQGKKDAAEMVGRTARQFAPRGERRARDGRREGRERREGGERREGRERREGGERREGRERREGGERREGRERREGGERREGRQRREGGERRSREREDRRTDTARRLDELGARMEKMAHALEELQKQVRQLRRRIR